LLTVVTLTVLARPAVGADATQSQDTEDRKDLVSAIKRLERKLGFRRTKSFHEESPEAALSYRCYYTGKLELPDSYEKLQLLMGTKTGCPLDPKKFDVFFYPVEAVGNGKSPVSTYLAHESVERFLFVVPHEDFHVSKELRKLPATWSEASATLVGLLTAAEVARQKFGENSEAYRNLRREPELFNRKAELVNRYFAELSRVYAAAHAGEMTEHDALAQKQQAFDEIHQACSAIDPNPKTFKRCLAADNNAGMAFDETYTKYYPLMYRLYLAKDRALKPTVGALNRVMNAKSDEEARQKLLKATLSDERD
jgi:hypothetical protein